MDSLATQIASNEATRSFNMVGESVKVFSILILIILLLYGVVFFLKKIMNPMGFKTGDNNIKLIENYYLSPKAKLSLIKVGNKFLLISEKDKQINLISEIPEDSLILNQNEIPKNKTSFKEIFKIKNKEQP